MASKKYIPEKIISFLREAEILINQGMTVAKTARKIGVTGLIVSFPG
jgi:hypothetical protein